MHVIGAGPGNRRYCTFFVTFLWTDFCSARKNRKMNAQQNLSCARSRSILQAPAPDYQSISPNGWWNKWRKYIWWLPGPKSWIIYYRVLIGLLLHHINSKLVLSNEAMTISLLNPILCTKEQLVQAHQLSFLRVYFGKLVFLTIYLSH